MKNNDPQQSNPQSTLIEQLKGCRPVLIKILVAGSVFFVMISLYRVDWSGFGGSQDQNVLTVQEDTTQGGKTTHRTTITTTDKLNPGKSLWDWMTLLLAPATLAGLGFLFQSNQEKTKAEKAEAEQNREKAQQEAEQKRETEQQHHQALQDYLAEISALLVDKKLKTMLPKKNHHQAQTEHASDTASDTEPAQSETSIIPSIDPQAALQVVKARTLSLLRLFDEDMPRKSSVLSFLGDTALLTALDLDLSSSDLEKADFHRANLSGANLSLVHLRDLSGADLSGADLSGADLTDAALSEVILWCVDLSSVKGLTPKQLFHSFLCNVLLPDDILNPNRHFLSEDIKPDSNRDCEKLPELLVKRYPEEYETLEKAKEFVDRLKSIKIK